MSRLFITLLAAVILLAACQSAPAPAPAPQPDPPAVDESAQEDDPQPDLSLPDIDLTAAITEETRDRLWQNVFYYRGESLFADNIADADNWYIHPFGWQLNGIATHFVEIVGWEEFTRWINENAQAELDGLSSSRPSFLITYFAAEGVTIENVIAAQESAYNRPREQIEALVNWARHGIDLGVTSPGSEEAWATMVFSVSDIEAIFSGDAERIWAAFPGEGVFLGGNVYTPEWILNHIEDAVNEAQIPLFEIMRIINLAEQYDVLEETIAAARAFLESRE
ncbi:MAG: hypothetical protein FWE32_07710 [Oscillospiraceae bacterium]|nr:hypothetical protein [Oscillospiraceae bacterium]